MILGDHFGQILQAQFQFDEATDDVRVSYGDQGKLTRKPLALTMSKASNLPQDEDPARSQAREVELE